VTPRPFEPVQKDLWQKATVIFRLKAEATRLMKISGVAATFMLALPCAAEAQRLELSINPTTITFPSSDPDTAPVVLSVPVQVTYRIRQNNNAPWTMTVRALGDLNSGLSTVDISNVTWIATPAPPFQNGTMSRLVAQRLASGTGNINPAEQGQITFRLANSWNSDAGVYTQVVLFTLTAP
jgi:hypothetical protein